MQKICKIKSITSRAVKIVKFNYSHFLKAVDAEHNAVNHHGGSIQLLVVYRAYKA